MTDPFGPRNSEFDGWIARANAAMAAGRNQEAVGFLGRALAIRPREAAVLNLRGSLLGALGRFDEAIADFRNAIAQAFTNADFHYNLAYALQCQNKLLAALSSYDAAVKLQPNHANAWNNRGVVLDMLGRYDEALASLEQARRLSPRDPNPLYNAGRVQAHAQNLGAACDAFRAALAIAPGHAGARFDLGRCQLRLFQPEPALENFRAILAADPGNAGAIEGLAIAHRMLGQESELIEACRTLSARAPRAPALWLERGISLAALNRRAEAEDYFRKARELDPKSAATQARIGRARIEMGDMDGATDAFAAACTLEPRSASHWCMRTEAIDVVPDDGIAATLENLLSATSAADLVSQSLLHFALGKAFADLGDKELSFSHVVEGNRLQRRLVHYDEAATLDQLDRTGALIPPEFVQRAGSGNDSSAPIFIVGMPRTGSTLVEQVLAAHKQVLALGELTAFQLGVLALDAKKGRAFPDWLPELDESDLSALADSYLARVLKIARGHKASFDPAAERWVDKMPGNFRYLGLIHLALPNAKIIHVRRDPVDTCLSCFQNRFEINSVLYANDLGELGRYYRAYDRLMARWTELLPESAMLTVQYETLLADFENEVRRILAFCGLAWDDACLSFDKVERSVRTASAMQVRKPLFAPSRKKWRPADEILHPLLDALAGGDR